MQPLAEGRGQDADAPSLAHALELLAVLSAGRVFIALEYCCRLHAGVNGSVARDGQLMPPLPHSFIPVSTCRSGLQMSAALSSSCEDLTLCGIKPEYVFVAFIKKPLHNGGPVTCCYIAAVFMSIMSICLYL